MSKCELLVDNVVQAVFTRVLNAKFGSWHAFQWICVSLIFLAAALCYNFMNKNSGSKPQKTEHEAGSIKLILYEK